MSKIGRIPIHFSRAKVSVDGQMVLIKGPNASFEHELPQGLSVNAQDNKVLVSVHDRSDRLAKSLWGLHRVLLANKIQGSERDFERKLIIVGLGYKGVVSGTKLVLTLGYTHQIDFEIPQGVTVSVDKTGQQLLFKSADKFLLGKACDAVKAFRRPEPYKGTGIMDEGQVIIRKAGKTKSSA